MIVAVKAGSRRFEISLGVWIFLIVGVLVLLVAGGALVATSLLGDRFAQRSAAAALDANHSARAVLQQQRYRQLQIISRVFATDEFLTSYLVEAAEARDPASILESLEDSQNLLGFDLAVVLDASGVVLARTGGAETIGKDLSSDPLVATALAQKQALGTWVHDGHLYDAAALPLARKFEQVGTILIAFSINDALARQIQRISRADTVFLRNSSTGPEAAASTLAPAAAAELISDLRLQGELLGNVTQRGETADQVEVTIQGGDWVAFLAPLRDAAGAPVGAAVAVTSFEERLADYRVLQLLLLGLGGAALIAGLLFSRMLSLRTAKPLGVLAQASQRASHGDYSAPLPASATGDVGRLRQSLAGLFGDLDGKQALEHTMTRVQRHLPEPAKSAVRSRARSVATTLLAVELRRFANPKIVHDPEESLSRMARDLRRIATAARSHEGRLESVFGHRALVALDGEGAAFRGLAAATEILHVLSERENVFDEPVPPVVALAAGSVATGSLLWGDHPSSAVAGLPIQQLESLLREAAPGEIYLSKTLYSQLSETFQRAGVELQAQRGLLSPQPLYALSGELAARLTGFTPTARTPAAFADERQSLSEVRPGTVLGGRFEVVAELGAGRMGSIWKAQDRELGDLVVLKMLKDEVVADTARFERLKRVIQQSRTLRHPNVLGVLDFAETDGLPYISVEYARGLTLRFLIDHGGRIGLAAGLYLARQICLGLQAAHQEGLPHLGLKPENVLVEPQGHARVMDFGLSLPDGLGVPAGVAYLAPEQLEGQVGDARSDIFAFGVVLYETFTGQVPYAAASPAEIRQLHQMQEPAPPSTLAEEMPPALEQIIVRCLEKAVDGRYGSLEELLGDLEAIRKSPG